MGYQVKNLNLAEQGLYNIELAEERMGALMKVRERFEKEKPLENLVVGMALHPTKETAALVRTFKAGGADVAICACNPLSTQDDVAAALAKEGVNIYAHKGLTDEEYYNFLDEVIRYKPNITIDDGCDLVAKIHKEYPEMIENIIAGCEETTTGIIRLKAMEKDNALKYPMIAVNDNKTKHLFDNYYGTGQSTWDGILRASNVLIAGKTVVVAGYGDCGKGVASVAKGLKANVIVTEVDNFRALQAATDGYRVMPMQQAAKIGDIFVTVTGNKEVIPLHCILEMKDKAILANSGHFDNEIAVKELEQVSKKKKTIRPLFDRYELPNGKQVYLCGEGRLVNLACAEGHPSEVMDLSFCGQSLAVEYAVKNKKKLWELSNKVITLPEEIDDEIARLKLEALGIEKDELTEDQEKYQNSWEEGT